MVDDPAGTEKRLVIAPQEDAGGDGRAGDGAGSGGSCGDGGGGNTVGCGGGGLCSAGGEGWSAKAGGGLQRAAVVVYATVIAGRRPVGVPDTTASVLTVPLKGALRLGAIEKL